MPDRRAASQSQPKSHRWQTVLNVLVPLVLTLFSAFAAIEVGYRVFYRLIPLEVCASDFIVANYYCQPYLVYDKPVRIAYRYRPGYKIEGWWDPAKPMISYLENEAAPSDRSDAFWFLFYADEMGFPNDEYEWRDRYDVIIAGDSFVTRSAPRTWIETLGERTGKTSLALGAASWSPLSSIEAAKMYGLDKNPEWVLVLFFEGNDLFNTAEYIERQESGQSWKAFDMRRAPWHRKLLTVHLARHWINKLGREPEEPRRYRYPVTASTEAGEIDLVFKDIHLLPMSADYDTLARSDEYARIKAELVELDRLCKAQDTRLLLVYVPAKEHVYWSRIWDPEDVNNILERSVTVTLSEGDRGTLEWDPQYISFETFNRNHNAQERLFQDLAGETGIEFLNLTPIFWQEAIARGELYNYIDLHWNQAGNDLAAEAIGTYMAR